MGVLTSVVGDGCGATFFLVRENLRCALCSGRTSPEPQQAKSDCRLGSDSLGNLAGMTRLTHDLDGRARDEAVLGLHNPGSLGQGCVKFPGRCHVGHAGENWSYPPGGRRVPTDCD